MSEKPRPRVRREPAEETIDIYPGLVVHDDRVAGAVTIGPSRVPLGVMIRESFGWETPFVEWEVVEAYYGFDRERFADFLAHLLAAPGELGRLLLALAEARRRWEREYERPYLNEQQRRARERGEPADIGFRIDPSEYPAPWWEHEELRAPVVDQLRRCLEALDPASGGGAE